MDKLKNRQVFKKMLHMAGAIAKTLLIIILIAAIIIGSAAAFIKYYKPADITELYQYDTILYENVSKRVLTTGNIIPSDYAYVYINTSQKVSEVHVKAGDSVSIGDLLISYDIEKELSDLSRRLESARLNEDSARLNLQSIGLPAEGNELMQYSSDVTSARHNVDQAQNEIKNIDKKIEQQQNKIDQAQRDADRNDILLQSGNLPQAEYDISVTTLDNAILAMDELMQSRQASEDTLETRQVQLQEAEQRLVNAQDRMSDEANVLKYRQQEIAIQLITRQIEQIQSDTALLIHESKSPVNGYVTSVNVREGEIAVKGVTLIEIAIISEILVRADVTEFDVPLLSIGMEAEITTGGLPDKVYGAHISKIAKAAIQKEKSSADEVIVPVEFDLADADEQLKIGYSVDIAIYTDKRNKILAVPIQSVLLEDDEKYLYILTDDELIKTPIETGFYGDRSVEILSGAKLGNKYVVTPSEVKDLPNNWFTRTLGGLYNWLAPIVNFSAKAVPVFRDMLEEN